MRPGFADLTSLVEEAKDKAHSRESYVREWFEARYNTCSLGHEIFEKFPLATIERHMVKTLVWDGNDVWVENGAIRFKEKKTIGVDQSTGARVTGDSTADRWERLIAQGINPFDPDMEAVTRGK